MTTYQDFRLTLELRSPLGTPMQSDTVFGHLAWLVALSAGPEGIRKFLEPFLAGDPPFVLSDAFPEGLLPRPLLPSHPESAPLAGRRSKAMAGTQKRLTKASFLELTDFQAVLRGGAISGHPRPNPWVEREIPHAAIDRRTWTTTPNGTFFQSAALTLPGDRIAIFLRATPDWADRLETMFRQLAKVGFGKDKSIGYGAFAVASFTAWEGLTSPEGANAFVSLSSFTPSSRDPVEGRWRLRIKRGRLGEGAGGAYPFKKPLIQFEPGAVFRTPASPPAPVYGRMVSGLAPGMPAAVQCGYTLAVACHWPA